VRIFSKNIVLPTLLFIVAFLAVPISQLHGLRMMPGDLGDARLNNYFLENVYQFLIGRSDSLWHLNFFYPFPYVLGFSDNLFGSAPIYLLARLMTGKADTAFQIWFLLGYAVNFGAAYFSLRRLGGSQLAATIGSLIFAFALPTSGQANHAQLHYRFGVPIAITFFILFLQQKEFRLLTIAGLWLVWQFYSSIYIGFFILLLIAVGLVFHFIFSQCMMKVSIIQLLRDFNAKWFEQSKYEKLKILFYFFIMIVALFWLFYPYLQVSHLYGFKRTWDEIKLMLPRPQSYFLSNTSYFWSSLPATLFAGIPMRWEHQMFIGFIPLALAIIGFITGNRAKNGYTYTLMVGILVSVILITLYIGGFSLWYYLYNLPLCSSIRAMTRIVLVLLFPVAYLAMIAIDFLRNYYHWGTKLIAVVIILMFFEFSVISMHVSPKDEWRNRVAKKEAMVPKNIPQDAILFFAQNQTGPYYAEEIDAMWTSMNFGFKTLNGYSGFFPPGYSRQYDKNCSELRKRVFSYLHFDGQIVNKDGYFVVNKDAYFGLIKRIVPIGFGCKSRPSMR
jgi:hypothetical protein